MTPSQSTDPGRIDPFKCSDCDKTCVSRSQLYIHRTVHVGKVPLCCETCKKEFPDALTLDLHQRKSSCQLQDRRRHVCAVCRRAYHCASTLALHQRVHVIPRPFACTFCTAAFSTRRTLTRHLQAHNHWEIPRCYLCGLVFSQQSTLRTHEFLLRCVYPHNCNVCGQKFSLRAQLRQHQRRHKTMLHGPFKCGICDKEFFLRKTLIVHWRRHMAGPTFSCYLCPKAFYLKTRLASHLRLHVLTDVSKEWRLKKTKEKQDADSAQCGPHSEEDAQNGMALCGDGSMLSDCSEATPLEVITSRKSIPSGADNNIYVEGVPSLEASPQGESGEGSMTYQQAGSRDQEDIVPKKSAMDLNSATDKETEAVVASPPAIEPPPPSFQCNICRKSFARNASLTVHQRSYHSSVVGGTDNGSSSTGGEAKTSTNVSAPHEALPLKQQSFSPFPYGGNSSVKIIVACSRCGERDFKSLEELEHHVCSELKDKDHTCHICGKHFKFRCRLTTHILKHQHVKPCRVPCL